MGVELTQGHWWRNQAVEFFYGVGRKLFRGYSDLESLLWYSGNCAVMDFFSSRILLAGKICLNALKG
jgi:hypothetical protein